MEWDWSLTEHSGSLFDCQDDLEHLFAQQCTSGSEWDWSLTKPSGTLFNKSDDVEQLFQTVPGRTEFDLDDSEWEVPEGLEQLFEPEKECEEEQLVTRSQPAEGLAAGSGSNYNVPGPVRGAAAPSPVGRHAHTLPAGIDNYKKTSKPRGSMEAQTPLSGVVLSAQQLNARKQNDRRAKVRAEAKLSNPVSQVCDKTRKVKAGASDVKGDTGRILDTVAAFWARKKAKANSETTD